MSDNVTSGIEMKKPKLKRQASILQPLVSSASSIPQYTAEMYTTEAQHRKRPTLKRHASRSRFSIEDLNYSFSATDIGYTRKLLLKRHRWMTDMQLALALFGIVVMVLNIELLIWDVYPEFSLESITLRLMVTISTILLVLCIIASWVVSVQLRMLDNGYNTWRIAVKTMDFVILFAEILICSVHPIPRDLSIRADMDDFSIDTGRVKVKLTSLDGILSIAMMSRLYIVIKFIAAHSDLRAEGSYQHFSSISTVKINIAFVFKALMSTKPGLVLVCFMSIIFVMNSWSLRTCEVFYAMHHHHSVTGFMNAMWLVAMTFLTVGYGDVVPMSYCGRFISAVTGIMGVATTALLVAVLARKLEQSQTERCVHNFVKRIHLERARRRAAANVIKMSARVWLRQNNDPEKGIPSNILLNKINQNVGIMRDCKRQLALLGESTSDLSDLGVSVNRIGDQMDKSIKRQKVVEDSMADLRSQMSDISAKLDRLLEAKDL